MRKRGSSSHVEQHEVGVFDELLHAGAEACHCRAVQNAVVRRNAEIDCLHRCPVVVAPFVSHVLGHGVGFADSDDGYLGPEDGGHEIAAADVADRGDAEGRVGEVGSGKLVVLGLLNQKLKIVVDLQNALVLNLLDVGHSKTVGAVDSDAEVVVLFEDVALDEAILVKVVVDESIHLGVLGHGNGARLDKERQHRDLGMHRLHLLAQVDQLRAVHLVREGKERNGKALRHGLHHCFVNAHNLLNPEN